MKFRGDKKRHIKFPYSSVEPERTQRAFDGVKPAQLTFYRLVLMSYLLEKKIKIREDKKRPINFSYFLAGAYQLNELFIYRGKKMQKDYRTLEYRQFEELKNRVKLIDFYWMRYKSQHPQKDYSEEVLDHIEVIEDFIYKKRYEELRLVKINFRRTKVKLPEKNYQKLKQYSELSNLLQNSLK